MESINSRDITNKKFSSGFRGYDRKEVDNFLQLLSKEFEILENKISHLNEKIEEQKVESDKFKDVESSLITTLKTAEDTGSKIVEKAKEDVKSILDDSRQELNNIKEEYDKVKSLRDSIMEEVNALSKKIDEGISDINTGTDFDELEKSIDAIEDNIDHKEQSEEESNTIQQEDEENVVDESFEKEDIPLNKDDEGPITKELFPEDDKEEDDTYEISTGPELCDALGPQRPTTVADLNRLRENENNQGGLEKLAESCLNSLRTRPLTSE